MTRRLFSAALAALASLALTNASAATPTEVVYTGPTIMQVGVDHEVRGHVQDNEGTRLGGPAGTEPSLRFTLGGQSKVAKAPVNQSLIKTTMKPATIGEDQPLTVAFTASASHDASSLTVPVDVWEYVLADTTHGAGMLLVNPSRSELRLITGGYDSGILTNVQMTAAGSAILLDVNASDSDGEALQLKGAFVPDRGTFAVAGLAAEPFALART